MTDTMIDLPGAIAKSDDADFLRELIQDAVQRLMDIEVAAVFGAGHGEHSPIATKKDGPLDESDPSVQQVKLVAGARSHLKLLFEAAA